MKGGEKSISRLTATDKVMVAHNPDTPLVAVLVSNAIAWKSCRRWRSNHAVSDSYLKPDKISPYDCLNSSFKLRWPLNVSQVIFRARM